MYEFIASTVNETYNSNEVTLIPSWVVKPELLEMNQ